jgi:hypothetical protein
MSTQRERLAACEEFLAELGKGIPDHERVMAGYADEATVQADASGKKLNAGWWPTPYKSGRHIPMEDNCYVCISSSIKTPNPKTGALRYWRGEASFGHGLALMVDDIGTGKGSKGELSMDQLCAILQPTATVETSPGNHQCWYFLDEPVDDRRRFKAFLMGFVSHVLLGKGGDSTIRDISRYGRMPAGINNKRTADGALKYPVEPDVARNKQMPFAVRLVQSDYSRRYGMDRIAAAFGFPIVVPVERLLSESEETEKNEAKYFDALWLKEATWILGRMKMGEGSGGEVSSNMSGKYRIACPWGNEHTNGDKYGAYFRGSIPGAEYDYVFGCGHDTCRKDNKRTWSVFVDKIVIATIAERLDSVNAKASDHCEDYKE